MKKARIDVLLGLFVPAAAQAADSVTLKFKSRDVIFNYKADGEKEKCGVCRSSGTHA